MKPKKKPSNYICNYIYTSTYKNIYLSLHKLLIVIGVNMLLFTFPMMFIGALGCIYLHLHREKITQKLPSKRLISSKLFYTLAS
jgi:hypothetical protein